MYEAALEASRRLQKEAEVCRQRLIEEEQAKAVVKKELRTVKGSLMDREQDLERAERRLADQAADKERDGSNRAAAAAAEQLGALTREVQGLRGKLRDEGTRGDSATEKLRVLQSNLARSQREFATAMKEKDTASKREVLTTTKIHYIFSVAKYVH